MTKNPFINALAATAYISIVASIMFYGPKFVDHHEDTLIMPISLISLFTLSAAAMGYIFLSKPFELYFAGEKQGAFQLFLKTIVSFALLTLIAFIIMFLQ